MKGEHYHKFANPARRNRSTTGRSQKQGSHWVMELDELVKIVKRSENTHEKIPPEDCKRIATFCWTFRDVLRDESFNGVGSKIRPKHLHGPSIAAISRIGNYHVSIF